MPQPDDTAASSLALLKGTLDVLVLKSLARGALHGYAVSRWLRETSGEAFQVEEGALYPALRRMETRGWLRSTWGVTDTGREARFYELTESGRRRLEVEVLTWRRYVEAMSRILLAAEAEPA